MGIVSSPLAQSNNNMKFLLLLAARIARANSSPVLKDLTLDMSLLLLLPLLQRLKGRREKLRLSPLLKPRLTPRPTLGYTIAACMVIMDTDMVDITMLL